MPDVNKTNKAKEKASATNPKTKPTKTKNSPSAAQLEANRQNALKSTGPRTTQGKAVSSMNGLTHGLRAQATLIPGEDAVALDARRNDWRDVFSPRNTTELNLVDDAVDASWRIDRCKRAEDAEFAKRARHAVDRDDLERETEFETLLEELPKNPRRVVPRLKRASLGCAWLLEQIQTLLDALEARGYWEPTERDHALHVCGTSHAELFTSALAYDLTSAHLAVTAFTPDHGDRLRILLHAPQPPGMASPEYQRRCERLAASATKYDPDAARKSLRTYLTSEFNQIAQREPSLRARDDLDRSEAPLRILAELNSTDLARMRYETNHRRSLQTTFKTLREEQSKPAPMTLPQLAPTEPNFPDPVALTPIPPTPPVDRPSQFRHGSDPLPTPPEPVIPEYYRMTIPQLRACADAIERLALDVNGLTPTPAALRTLADEYESNPFPPEDHIPRHRPRSTPPNYVPAPAPRDMSNPLERRRAYHYPPEELYYLFREKNPPNRS